MNKTQSLQRCWSKSAIFVTCLALLPPGSVTGASEMIDWFAFVPTTKLLLPGRVVWMVMPPPLDWLLVVGVCGVVACDLLLAMADSWFKPFPLFNELDDCTNGIVSCKFIVTVRSSLMVTHWRNHEKSYFYCFLLSTSLVVSALFIDFENAKTKSSNVLILIDRVS